MSSLKQKKSSLIDTASYMTVGTLTVVSISSLFVLFMMISFIDDCIRVLSPKRWIDWPLLVNQISTQLTYFAEWEKSKRASWYPENHPIYHQDKFHDLISAVTGYMNDYVQQKRRDMK